MWLGSRLTALSDYLFRTFFRVLFRYDIFISYARRDGKDYAVKLRDQLRQLDFSCFLDFDELPAGNSLNKTLRRALRRSATLVVVGTERAVKSRYVELEVGAFAGTSRPIIPIDIEGSLAGKPWAVIGERDLVWIDEVKAALTRGVPSPNVADQIDKLFKYTRRNSRVRAQVLATIGLFAVVVLASLFLIRQQVQAATAAASEAERQKTEAVTQKRAAESASAVAEERRMAAEAAADEARRAQDEAKVALDKAGKAEKAANAATAEAKRQEVAALRNAERARREQERAEERTRYVQAQQVGVQASLSLDAGENPERGVLLSVESLKKSFTPEGFIAWARGVSLIPRADETGPTYPAGGASAAVYSPDGRWLALGGKGAVTLHRADAPAEPLTLRLASDTEVRHVSFIREGEWLAAAGKTEARVWDLKTLKPVASLNTGAEAVAFSPDGRYAAMSGWDTRQLVRVFNVADGSKVFEMDVNAAGYVSGLAFSPSGRWLVASCATGRIVEWDVKTFAGGASAVSQPKLVTGDESNRTKHVAFDRGGNIFASLSMGDRMMKNRDTVLLSWWFWSEANGAVTAAQKRVVETPVLGLEDPMYWSLSFSPRSNYIALAARDNTARVWDLMTGHEVARLDFDGPVAAVAFSADAKRLATLSGGLKFWRAGFDAGAVHLPYGKQVTDVAADPRGRWLAVGGEDGLRVFRTSDWSLSVKRGRDEVGIVSDLLPSPDGHWLFINSGNPATGEQSVLALETEGWKVVNLPDTSDKIADVDVSPGGRWMAVSAGRRVTLFEQGAARAARTLEHTQQVTRVLFSPDGQYVAVEVKDESSANNEAAIFVWEAAAGRLLACGGEPSMMTGAPRTAGTFSASALCPDLKGQSRDALLGEVAAWESREQSKGSGGKSDESPDGRWAVKVSSSQADLFFKEGNTTRSVARLPSSGDRWAFTPDGRWLAVTGGWEVSLWPLSPADMIEGACARLRRPDLSAEEWQRYFSEQKTQPTCVQK